MTLQLGRNISLPDEAITETFGILAARGAGKSNTAAVMAEEMYARRLPFVVVDPVGSWWGLRSNKKGTGPGLKITLFGGKRGDVPLERTGGNLVADLVVDERLSCILDLTQFDSEGAKRQFLLDFARRLYKRNEQPLHLFLEEADDYIPQTVVRAEVGESAAIPGMLLRAWENIVRRGRARGLGMTMITQRSAAINKNVLTQVQTLIAMRTTGPQDRKAIEEWVKYNDQSLDILKTLSGLAPGEAWVWSPVFLKETKRVKFRRRHTFDSGSTPKMAAKSKTAKLAKLDVSKLREQMADTIARADADDPKVLRKRIAVLEKAARYEREPVDNAKEIERVLRPWREWAAVAEEKINNLRKAIMVAKQTGEKLTSLATLHGDRLPAQPITEAKTRGNIKPVRKGSNPLPPGNRPKPPPPPPNTRHSDYSTGALPRGEAKVLTAVAQHEDGVDREQLTILTGYKQSTRNLYIQKLKAAGMIDTGPPIRATTLGLQSLPAGFEPLPTGAELREHWLASLPFGERSVLELVLNAHPGSVSRELISDETGYKSSTRNLYIQKLKSRKLIVQSGSGLTAHAKLYE